MTLKEAGYKKGILNVLARIFKHINHGRIK